MGPRNQRPRRLVEADVPVEPEAENLQVDAARAIDGAFVGPAFLVDVARRPVQEVNPPRRQVDVIEQVALHECAIAARIAGGETKELVEVEGRGAAEIDAPGLVQPSERAIQRNRRPARWQAQHETGPRRQGARDITRARARQAERGVKDSDPHHG